MPTNSSFVLTVVHDAEHLDENIRVLLETREGREILRLERENRPDILWFLEIEDILSPKVSLPLDVLRLHAPLNELGPGDVIFGIRLKAGDGERLRKQFIAFKGIGLSIPPRRRLSPLANKG